MKILKGIFTFILEIILAVAIVVIVAINTLNSTILNKNYIFSKLEKTNYYSQIYKIVQENFEKYIEQSGLDESVISNIVTEEQIKSDIKIIIDNIFEGTNKEIASNELKQALIDNIKNSVGSINSTQEKAIQVFAQKIVDEYSANILNSEYISEISQKVKEVQTYISQIKKWDMLAIIISIAIMLLLNIKLLYKFVRALGISGLTSGVFLIVVNKFVNTKVDIQSILMLNESFSRILRDVLTDMLNKIQRNGILFVVIAIIAIIASSFIHNARTNEED